VENPVDVRRNVIACPVCLGRVTGVTTSIGARGRVVRSKPCGHDMPDDLGGIAARYFGAPLPPVTGAALTAAERRRQVVEEGHHAESDAGRDDLAWMAWCLADRAVHGTLNDQDPPLMWPPDRDWTPGRTPIRALTIAAALLCAEIDRRLAAGEKP
jgi:hypothetical protein